LNASPLPNSASLIASFTFSIQFGDIEISLGDNSARAGFAGVHCFLDRQSEQIVAFEASHGLPGSE